MAQKIKSEMFFASEANAIEFFRQSKFESSLYNLIRFTYFNGEREVYFHLVTPCSFMTVVCEVSTYLGMLARYSCRKFGYEPVERGYFLSRVELMSM